MRRLAFTTGAFVVVVANIVLGLAWAASSKLESFIPDPSEHSPVKVFDLPLGGKFVQKLKQCPKDDRTEIKELCQRGKPSRMFTDGRVIKISLPDGSLPLWAYSHAELLVTSEGVLTRIKASSLSTRPAELAKSISLRFGQPDVDMSDALTTWKTWLTKDIVIQASGFHGDCCDVEFVTRDVYDAQARRSAKARDERPLTP